MSAPTVFISYSHADEVWMKGLLRQLRALEQAGVPMQVWHDRRIDGGDKWYPEIQHAMENAAAAVLLISADFLSSPFCVQEEVPALLKRQELQHMLVIPVLLKPCVWEAHRWLKDRQMLPRDGKSVAVDFAGDRADEVFTAVATQILAHFDHLSSATAAAVIVPAQVQALTTGLAAPDPAIVPPAPAPRWPPIAADCVDLTHLPETGRELFGRDQELALLDSAWIGSESTETPPRILAFIAHGGVGKSTLVNRWLAEMKRDHFRGATKVFGWSFYSQGVREDTSPSADTFIAEALRFFGDEATAAGAVSPWEKGARLARLAGDQRALLVLDGLEPLQSAHQFERGKLRDPAVESLLRGLARESWGLCLITTREPLPDLAARPGVTTRDLEQITVQAGRALLRTARVVGTDAELEALAERFGPHALAVSLVGVYLQHQPGHRIAAAQTLERQPGERPIDRVLAGFERWLGDGPEREALRFVGFFDRPADAGCLRALRQPPAIPGLTEHLPQLDDLRWDDVLDRLEDLGVIHVRRRMSGQREVDAHPLVREHFAQFLKHRPAWRAGHRRLYKHLCASTKEGNEPALEDLQPLFQAVAHGCQAGEHQDACDNVYYRRIQREAQSYSSKQLGAFGSNLAAVACFFESTWSRVVSTVTEGDQAWLLNEAALSLRAVGRLTEALEAIRANLRMRIERSEWKHAPSSASNLSELELTLGDVPAAVHHAAQSVSYADRIGVPFEQLISWTTHACALQQAGRRDEAEALFRAAEHLQAEQPGQRPWLYSLRGFSYCDLLLEASERAAWQRTQATDDYLRDEAAVRACREVSQRATTMLEWYQQTKLAWVLDLAFNHLTLSRTSLYRMILENSNGQLLASDASFVEAAVDGFRGAGLQEKIPLGLVTRAWWFFMQARQHRQQGATKDAAVFEKRSQVDLDEAWEIAERGPMKLHMTDIHLYRARLFFRADKYPWESPQKDLAEAERLIEECGYGRRREELANAKRAILGE